MEWIVADLKIAVVLLAWIVAMVGVGNIVYNAINSRKTKANSSLGETFRPFENFEHSLESSLASRPKFSKEAKAFTANTRILGETQETQGDSAESSDSKITIDCHEAKASRNDDSGAVSSNSITSRNDDSITSSLRGQRPKQSINANNLAESRRSERVKSAESHIESAKDSINSSDFVDSSDSKNTINCHDLTSSSLTMTAKGDFVESAKDSNVMDCHEFNKLNSRNDGIGVDSHALNNLTSRNDNSANDKQRADFSHSMQSPTIFPDNFAIRIFASLLFGVIIVSFLTSLLHLFFPITSIFSIAFLVLGIALFALKIRDFHLLDFRVLFSGAVAFAIVAILGFFHDSIGDSVNYHIQIVTWIQNSPLIFGLGNIHGRLGFNGIIYNFYALSDVSQIFPSLRSFIANEIIYFAFIFAVVYILATGAFRRFYLLFIVCCAIPFSFVLKWGEFNGLYCEGIGLVFGVFVGAMVCYVIETYRKKGANSHEANSSLCNHCIDLVFSHEARTQSPLSLCQNTKNSTSKTADTRILGESIGDSVESSDSKTTMDCHEAKASRNDDSGAVSSNSIISRNDASLSSLRGQRPKQSINANNLAESRRSERVKSAESHIESAKDSINSSDFVDSSDSKNKIDCHDLTSSSLAMTAKGKSARSITFSNDKNGKIPRKWLESHEPTMAKPTHFSNALLFILFIISVFAAQVKIANTALCLCVAIIFIYLNRDFYRIKFYKYYAILGILCVIFVLPWAIKGVATSGMVAYPAGIFFFESLPFAVSEAQRESEVCWIMSWARAPGKNCVEVLANSAWVGEWFSMKTRYFGWYFKYFVYNFFASLALLSVIIIYAKAQKRRIESVKYLIVFLAFFAGAIFWFFSGPDPRFGMVYIFPLIGILLAFNITEIKNIASKKARIIFIVALLLTLMPFWNLTRDMYIILILLCVLLPSLSAKWRKIYYALIIILSFVSIPNIYRKQLGSIKQLPKVLPIYAQERITDYGVSVFHRSDELKEGYKAYDYEPMPTTPYFSSHIKEERFLGRKAYINTNKDSK